MLDPSTPASTRARCAESVLSHSAKAIEREDIEATRDGAGASRFQRYPTAMKCSIDRRLDKLEDKLGIATNRPRVVVVMSDLVGRGLDDDTCLQILREGGFPPAGDVATVDLCLIPAGLSAKETEGLYGRTVPKSAVSAVLKVRVQWSRKTVEAFRAGNVLGQVASASWLKTWKTTAEPDEKYAKHDSKSREIGTSYWCLERPSLVYRNLGRFRFASRWKSGAISCTRTRPTPALGRSPSGQEMKGFG